MIVYQTHYLGFKTWGDVEKLTLNNKGAVIRALSMAAEMDNCKEAHDTHVEYHPTKRAAERYMEQFAESISRA